MTLKRDRISFDKTMKRKKRNIPTHPLKFLSLYAIKTNNVIYELKYLILSIMSGILHLHLFNKYLKDILQNISI